MRADSVGAEAQRPGSSVRASRSGSFTGSLSPWLQRKKKAAAAAEETASSPVSPHSPVASNSGASTPPKDRLSRSASVLETVVAKRDAGSSDDALLEDALVKRKVSPSDIEAMFAHLLVSQLFFFQPLLLTADPCTIRSTR